MLTTDDIVLMTKVFATKADLKQLEEKMANKHDFNKIMNGIDKVIGELKTVRIEQAANQSAHDRFEERLEEIEKVPVIAHSIKAKK